MTGCSPAVELVRIKGLPAEIGDSGLKVIDQFDWLQLTIGRFLAPAAVEPGVPDVAYVITGERSGTIDRVTEEIEALGQAFARLGEHLEDMIAEGPSLTEAFVSLQVLLELRLPDPKWVDVFHMRDGFLLIAGWGLQDGVRLGDLLSAVGTDGDARSKAAGTYLSAIRAVFGDFAPVAVTDVGRRNDFPPIRAAELAGVLTGASRSADWHDRFRPRRSLLPTILIVLSVLALVTLFVVANR